MKVKELMEKNPIVVEVPGTREKALRLMGKHEISGMPVVRADTRELLGVVTRSDIFENPKENQLALLMTDEPLTIEPDDELEKAARLLFENRIHGLPVVEEELVGIISPTEILKTISEIDERKVEEYLAPICAPIYEETPLAIAMKILCITDAGALPVLGEDGKMIGIVTDGDLLDLSHVNERMAELDIGIGKDGDEWSWEGLRDVMRLHYATSKLELPGVSVKEVMVGEVKTAFKKSSISCAAKKMLEGNIDQLPVIDEKNELVGMVYDIDLMRAIYE